MHAVLVLSTLEAAVSQKLPMSSGFSWRCSIINSLCAVENKHRIARSPASTSDFSPSHTELKVASMVPGKDFGFQGRIMHLDST